MGSGVELDVVGSSVCSGVSRGMDLDGDSEVGSDVVSDVVDSDVCSGVTSDVVCADVGSDVLCLDSGVGSGLWLGVGLEVVSSKHVLWHGLVSLDMGSLFDSLHQKWWPDVSCRLVLVTSPTQIPEFRTWGASPSNFCASAYTAGISSKGSTHSEEMRKLRSQGQGMNTADPGKVTMQF